MSFLLQKLHVKIDKIFTVDLTWTFSNICFSFLNFKVDVESKENNKDKTQTEISLKNLKFFKEEGIALAERECFWQAIGRWDEALEIKVPEKSAIELEHEKILEMKAQVLSTLHEWELAIEAAKSAVKIEPKWWSAYQTLGRAHLGFGQIQEAVIVSFFFFL